MLMTDLLQLAGVSGVVEGADGQLMQMTSVPDGVTTPLQVIYIDTCSLWYAFRCV